MVNVEPNDTLGGCKNVYAFRKINNIFLNQERNDYCPAMHKMQ